MKLVIVESPTKAKTISKFLGKDYVVESSYGHVRDLPKNKLNVDVENNFEPHYAIPKKAGPKVAELKKMTKKSSGVVLATDEDREGEAIAWHLTHALGIQKEKAERIVFHEITESAIKKALSAPREINMDLVDAQQARRILDRIVGYELSPFLWRKIRYGLSAGRVQSVALRLIVEREREIEKFNPEEYWTIEADLQKKDSSVFRAKLRSIDGKTLGKFDVPSEERAREIVKDTSGKKYVVKEISTKEVSRSPAPPFTTSTLQQDAARKLGFSAKQTMTLAQRLYESGLITYMRTDSVNMASQAVSQARSVIEKEFGKKYLPEKARGYKAKSKGAQEAHEAIRPTDFSKTSAKDARLKDKGKARLYELIWKRATASQMQNARMEQTAVDISVGDKYEFRATGQVIAFDGFLRAHSYGENSQNNEDGLLPKLLEGDELNLKELLPIQHFTEPPPRYSDASLVKALEQNGVGRPSTYAPTLSTIQERGYVEKEDKKYKPTEIGMVVTDLLVEHFPEIIDVGFTSEIEEELDEIARGERGWRKVIKEFYDPFIKRLKEKEKTVEKKIEISDTPCPHCSEPMVIKFGRMGKFLACPDPEVKVTLPMPEEQAKIDELEEKTKDERCPLCEGEMNVKRGRFGYFLGCANYPECKGISKIWNKTGFKCPVCLESEERKDKPGDVAEKKRRGRGKSFYACTLWPACEFVMNKKPESEDDIKEGYEIWKKKKEEEKKEKKSGKKKAKRSSKKKATKK